MGNAQHHEGSGPAGPPAGGFSEPSPSTGYGAEDPHNLGQQVAGGQPAAPGRSLRWLRWLIILLLVGVVAWLFLGKGDRTETANRGPGQGRRPDVAIAVRAESVDIRTIIERASYPGELSADAVDISGNVAGRLAEVRVRVGDQVQAGQEVLHIDETDYRLQLSEARIQVRATEAAERRASTQMEGVQRELERTQDLAADQLVSAQSVDSIQVRLDSLSADMDTAIAQRAQARARIAILEQKVTDCTVVAPFSGTVSDRYRDPGVYVQPGTPVIRLVSDGPLRIVFDVPESESDLVPLGADFAVQVAVTGDLEVTGTVSGSAREVVAERRSVRVEGTISDPPGTWLSGMYARVTLVRRVLADTTTVPGAAVLRRIRDDGTEDQGVFQVEDGHARWREVRILGREGDRVAVEGVDPPPTRVLVVGHEDLPDGASIALAGEGDGSR